MSVFALKLTALLSMIIDHIGARAGLSVLRLPGRLAFPIYAYLIGNGFRHTHSKGRYLLRLLLLAVISQVPYTLCLDRTVQPVELNIFFSLALGLLWIWVLDAEPWKAALGSFAILAVACVLDRIVGLDYDIRGVLLIVVLYVCDGKSLPRRAAMAGSFILLYYWPILERLLTGAAQSGNWYLNLPGILALPLISSYNGEPGLPPRAKRPVQLAFYLAYPLHLLALCVLLP